MPDNLTSRFQTFWHNRADRERWMLGLGAGVLALGLLYGAIYAPLQHTREKLQKRLPVQRAELRLIEAQASQIEHLRHKGSGVDSHGNLQRQIESSAVARNLRAALKRVTAIGTDQVQVSADAQPIEAWVNWLDELERNGVRVRSLRLTVTSPGNAGLVATFSRGSS